MVMYVTFPFYLSDLKTQFMKRNRKVKGWMVILLYYITYCSLKPYLISHEFGEERVEIVIDKIGMS